MFKAGYITVVGKPNAGKSTLVNKLVGFKVAITTPKPQTTRFNIKGIITNENSQMILIDTPGVHIPKDKMGEYMMKNVMESEFIKYAFAPTDQILKEMCENTYTDNMNL